MRKWIFLLSLCLLLQGMSGCMLSTVDDLPEKAEIIDTFRHHQELFFGAVEELQSLWEEHVPYSISISLESTKVCAVVYYLDEDGYHLKKTELKLENENLCRLLRQTVKHGIYMDEDGIDFQCAGAGFGPNTAYSGIFYTPTENISDLPFFPYKSDRRYDPDYNSVGSDGGYKVEIERVEAGFFYYRKRQE